MVNPQIFVGRNQPNQSSLNPIRNQDRSNRKPKGGFWTSPGNQNTLSSFEKYESGSLIRDESQSWLLYPKGNTRVMRIESKQKLHELPNVEHFRRSFIDFEAVFDRNQIDGIYFSKDLVHKKAFSNQYNMYGWDVETILWNNVSWIRDVKNLGDANERVTRLI